jgi:hypothetical protein
LCVHTTTPVTLHFGDNGSNLFHSEDLKITSKIPG